MQHGAKTSLNFIDVLAEIIPAKVPVALLDFLWHSNPGDSVIRKGETLALATLGHQVVCTATKHNFDRNRLAAAATPVILANEEIVTDRLHAVPFGLAHGRSTIAVDGGYGKLDSYIDTFFNEEPLLHPLSSFDQLSAVLEKTGSSQ